MVDVGLRVCYVWGMKMTREEFISKLVELRACKESLEWIQSTPGTPEELWLHCPNLNWLLWLTYTLDLKWNQTDYDAKMELIDADYHAKMAPIWADYDAKKAPIWADYHAKMVLIDADYDAKKAPILRSLVSWADVEAALVKM